MKTINATKLATMSLPKISRACTIHAQAAIDAKKRGDTAAFDKHCGLLDQCGAVGRSHPDNPRRKTT
jgi:hypothetical protein